VSHTAQREIIRMLEENGFSLKRKGKHLVYSDGFSNLVVPHGSKTYRQKTMRVRKDIEKALAARAANTPAWKNLNNDEVKLRGDVERSPVLMQTQDTSQPFNSPRGDFAGKTTTQATGAMRKEFTRKQLFDVILPMRNAGNDGQTIVDRLYDMGYRTKDGKKFDRAYVSKVVLTYGGESLRLRAKNRKRRAQEFVAPKKKAAPVQAVAQETVKQRSTNSVYTEIADIALSNLSDETKTRVLKTMLESL
jgi:predicted RNA binding protein YcfA (HicA-like mRNA interferase family)